MITVSLFLLTRVEVKIETLRNIGWVQNDSQTNKGDINTATDVENRWKKPQGVKKKLNTSMLTLAVNFYDKCFLKMQNAWKLKNP